MKTKFLLLFILICGIANAQYTNLLNFAGIPDGSNPNGSLISDGTFLYGMTQTGGIGSSAQGTLFKIMPDGTGYLKLLDFTGSANGSSPVGSLIYDGTYLYGMTRLGGTNNVGVLFKIMPDGTGYSKLLDFDGTNGSYPYGELIYDGTFLYGMTYSGGLNDLGVIFKIMPDGTGYTKLLDFDGSANGSNPNGSLIFDGSFFYGMTNTGGINNMGVIFKIMADGTGYTKLLDFAGGLNGSNPFGCLILEGSFLYGMTSTGGIYNLGALFKILPDGTGYLKLLDFSATANGSKPYGSLISDGTFLYGMCFQGGSSGLGTFFKILPDGTAFSKLLDFTGANGANPWGSLLSIGTSLYGMTIIGGTNNVGTIFKYGTTTNSVDSEDHANLTLYPNPFTSSTTLKSDRFLNDASVLFYNLFGQRVAEIRNVSGQTLTLHRANLPSGLYFVRVMQENEVIFNERVIITD